MPSGETGETIGMTGATAGAAPVVSVFIAAAVSAFEIDETRVVARGGAVGAGAGARRRRASWLLLRGGGEGAQRKQDR
ncbi:MAG: hypothetical protein QM756_13460 [Polyangiaceae bacterium]